MLSKQSKQDARERAKKLLRDWATKNRPAADAEIARNLSLLLAQFDQFSIQGSGTVGIFAPLASEPQWTLPLGPRNFPRLAFPLVQGNQMQFRSCRLGDLVGAEQPLKVLGAPVEAPLIVPQMLVIPGLAFSWKGERLGRGKGFYDNYLERYQGIKVALSFSVVVWDELPVESHDQRVDWLVTEQGIFNCQRGAWV